MPSGKGTYGNQVGRPPKDIYSGAMEGAMVGGAAGAIGGMAAPTIESLLNSGSITPQQAQLMRGTQDYRMQVDQEMLQREALARALRNRPGQGVMTDQDMQNFGNPTSRSYADPELDAALRNSHDSYLQRLRNYKNPFINRN